MNERLCDSLIDYFNRQLTPQEHQLFEEHLKTCSNCREELEELELLTADLPFSSEPVTTPEGMKERVLSAVFNEELKQNGNVIPMTPPPLNNKSEQKIQPEVIKKKPRRNNTFYTIAALLFLSVAGNAYFLSQNGTDGNDTANVAVDHLLNTVALVPTKGNEKATASMVKKGDHTKMVIQASQLEKVKGDQVYQVWLIQKDKPVRAGTFVPSKTGDGSVIFDLNNEESQTNWDTVAVTLEPDANSQTPKGKIVLAASL